MRQRFIIFFVIFLLLLLVISFYFREEIKGFYRGLNQRLLEMEEKMIDNLIEELEKKVSTPPPLMINQEGELSELGSAEIVSWTNVYRVKNGLSPLQRNTELDRIASIKADDMFAKQYFAHQSPTGEGPAQLAQRVGYDFLAIGENLALGNFPDERSLVEAWLASPGHRENILSSTYTEIGVAVVQGIFEGKKTWIAVQEFALPESACPRVDRSLKVEIELYKKQLAELEKALTTKHLELENIKPQRTPEYFQKVEEYNQLVIQYNNLIKIIKNKINLYNFQVEQFNRCINR